ncbi:hypothetical protein Rs2_29158 [Raphanus sativus]|nr:hypothetical protein Rs2_29158 [Raphanus sativus]
MRDPLAEILKKQTTGELGSKDFARLCHGVTVGCWIRMTRSSLSSPIRSFLPLKSFGSWHEKWHHSGFRRRYTKMRGYIYKKDREPLGVLLGKSADPESRSSQDWAREIQIQTNPATQISWSKDAIFKRKVRSKNEDYSSYGRSEGSFSNWVEKFKSRLES